MSISLIKDDSISSVIKFSNNTKYECDKDSYFATSPSKKTVYIVDKKTPMVLATFRTANTMINRKQGVNDKEHNKAISRE